MAERQHRGGAAAVRITSRERDFVLAVTRRFLHDPDEAGDATQDALLRAFRKRNTFRGDSSLTTWLYRIAATTALMRLRQRRPERNAPLLDDHEHETLGRGPAPTPEQVAAARETLTQCARVVAAMSAKYRDVFVLYFVEGRSEADIARRLGLARATVKTRAHRARTYLRRRLASAEVA